MKPTKCKNCGANDFVRKGDKYVCQYCGTEYPISAEELEKEKKADAKKSSQKSSAVYQSTTVSHSAEKSGYVNASPTKPLKKKMSRGTQTAIIVVIVIAVLAIIATMSSSDSDDNNEADERSVAVETETMNATEATEATETEKETGATNVEVQKTNNPGAPINDFNYDISGDEVMLQSYSGSNNILEIYSSYTIDGLHYRTNLADFQVRDHDVKIIIFDEGITEVKTSVFNSSDIEAIYFPASMVCVYDYTLSYLHPDEGERIKIYYGGSEEQWYNIFTEYQRTSVSDATSAAEAGSSLADALNELVGVEYDSSEFEYFFDASPDDLK